MMKNIAPDDFEETLHEDPLAKYYRMPGVHVKLPSNGAFMPPGALQLTMNGDLPVYPMRAADELLLKSPDALMSGFAIEELIKSCVPGVRIPRMVSSADLDVMLLAIRAATYGAMITVKPDCPKCGEENEIHANLTNILATVKAIPPENPVRLSDEVVVFLRPYNMDNATRMGIVSYEESRKVQALVDGEETQRIAQMNHSMQRIVQTSMDVLSNSVLAVVVKEGKVCDPYSIRKFIDNVSKAWIDKLQAKMDELNEGGIDKHYDATCAHCGHQWRPLVEFNPATFFASAS
jgi:hypothetical protein